MKAAAQMRMPCAYGSFASGAEYFELCQQKSSAGRWHSEMLDKLQHTVPQKQLWEWSVCEY